LPGKSHGAWWAAVAGVVKSRTRLKRLSSSSSSSCGPGGEMDSSASYSGLFPESSLITLSTSCTWEWMKFRDIKTKETASFLKKTTTDMGEIGCWSQKN